MVQLVIIFARVGGWVSGVDGLFGWSCSMSTVQGSGRDQSPDREISPWLVMMLGSPAFECAEGVMDTTVANANDSSSSLSNDLWAEPRMANMGTERDPHPGLTMYCGKRPSSKYSRM